MLNVFNLLEKAFELFDFYKVHQKDDPSFYKQCQKQYTNLNVLICKVVSTMIERQGFFLLDAFESVYKDHIAKK